MYYDERKEVVAEAPIPLDPWRRSLLRAADYIREHGWCQNAYYDRAGRVCLLGAILKVEKKDVLRDNVTVHRLARYLRQGVPGYNDAPGRTSAEVIAALEGAARQR